MRAILSGPISGPIPLRRRRRKTPREEGEEEEEEAMAEWRGRWALLPVAGGASSGAIPAEMGLMGQEEEEFRYPFRYTLEEVLKEEEEKEEETHKVSWRLAGHFELEDALGGAGREEVPDAFVVELATATAEDDEFGVSGTGSNVYGEFTVAGTLRKKGGNALSSGGGDSAVAWSLVLERTYGAAAGEEEEDQQQQDESSEYLSRVSARLRALIDVERDDGRETPPPERYWENRADAKRILCATVPALRPLSYIDRRTSDAAVAALLADQAALSPLAIQCWSLDFCPDVFHRAVRAGFLPMSEEPGALGTATLLLRSGPERCLFGDLEAVHISKRVRKLSKRFRLSLNLTSLAEVVAGVQAQHGGSSWLFPPYVQLLSQLLGTSDSSGATRGEPDGLPQAQPLCLELRDKETGRLVAGELGFALGACYTSLTGFHDRQTHHCGSIQIVAASALLHRMGFTMWDLDQPLPYMRDLGAVTVAREEFLRRLGRSREARVSLDTGGVFEAWDLVRELEVARDYKRDNPLGTPTAAVPPVVAEKGTPKRVRFADEFVDQDDSQLEQQQSPSKRAKG